MNIVKIEKIAYGGKGLGRLDGKVCFVENALPGETVEIEIIRDKKNLIEARAINIESPSTARENPPCPYYGSCGGCQYQHMTYFEELRWKEIQIREALQKQLSLADEIFLPIVGSSNPYHYRNHITLHDAKNGWGFVDEDNQSTIAIQSCLIAKKELNAWLAKDRRPETEDKGLDPRLRGDDKHKIQTTNYARQTIRVGAGGKVTTSAEDIFFNLPIGDVRLRTHSRCFFQANLEITLKIAEKVKVLYEKLRPDHFWDLYAGVGTFTVLIHPRLSQILCVESSASGVEALEMNLKNLGLAAEIAPEEVENCLADILAEERQGPVFAILDPPRIGLHPAVIEALCSGKGPNTIAYLSCHMGALGRDLKALGERAYSVESIQAFDMFPRTKHIETLVFLRKRKTTD